MMEHRLYDPAEPPDWLDPQWWRDRPHCDHLNSPTGAHVARLRAAADLAYRATGMLPLSEKWPHVVDLGAGDGALLSLLPEQLRERSFGYDIITEDVEYAQNERRVNVTQANVQTDFYDHDGVPIELAPVVALTEVLEHMAHPHGFLTKLHARPEVRFVVASSPHSETPERHEWNHAWAWDPDGYREMFGAAGFQLREVQQVEWSMLCLFEAVR
jgi:2-polyprenyl-3-methyl-5-hydroxy-6-metoxy-1,4-benzoquinol methylase